MIQALLQYSQSKVHLRHKWRQQKSWIWFPDCQDAQDKQQTQYPLKLRSEWKMLPNYWKFPNRNVQIFGFVYHDTNGPNHDPVLKTQLSLLNGFCTVIFWQDKYGNGNLRKCYNTVGKKFQIGNALVDNREKGLFLSVYVDDIKLAGKKQNISPT